MSENRYPSQKLDQYMLRLPDGMRDRIKAVAEANNRSMNAEIVATLEEKYPAPLISQEELLLYARKLVDYISAGGNPNSMPEDVQEAASIIRDKTTLNLDGPTPMEGGAVEFSFRSLNKGETKA